MDNNNSNLFLNLKPNKKELIALLISFVIGFLFFQLFFFPILSGIGIGFAIFVIAFQLTAGFYLNGKKFIFSRLAIFTFIPVVLMALSFATFQNNYIVFFNILAIWFFSVLNLLVMSGLEEYPFKAHVIGDVFRVTFAYPFKNLSVTIKRYFSLLKSKAAKNILITLLTLLVLSPFIALILFLLGSSDQNFKNLTDTIVKFLSDDFAVYLFKVVLSVIFGFFMINVFFNLSIKLPEIKASITPNNDQSKKMSAIVPVVGLSVFSVIYTFYIFIQGSYLFSAIVSKLPDGYTYSEYARQGFFELCFVVFFNLLLLGLTYLLSKKKDDVLPLSVRITSGYLILCTILLNTTALSKMVLYINNYGLTPSRFYTSFFMTVVFILSIFLLIKTFIPKFKFKEYSFITVACLYILLNLSNVDAIVAKVNVERYYETGKIDTFSFAYLSPSAAPVYIDLKNDKSMSDNEKQNLKYVLEHKKSEITYKGFETKTISDYIALNYLK